MNIWEWCTAHSIELIIAAVCVAILIMIIVINLTIAVVHKRKKKSAINDVGKILKTIDGYFNDRPDIDKSRRIAVIEKRKDDGAIAVVKIYSQKGKSGKAYIANLVLTPEEHKSLTENSIVGSQVIIGVKQKNGSFKPIFTRELTETEDELSSDELKAVKKGVHNDTPKHKRTYKNRMSRWRRHFRK